MLLTDRLKDALKGIKGDILQSSLQRKLYASDASIYERDPLLIILPRNEDDICQVLKAAELFQVPITARGGGTSLAGQTVGKGIVVDFTRYMDQILEIQPEEKRVRVQSGVVLSHLNRKLKKWGLMFAPDPSTANRATIGGMIANNSSGTRSIRYGKTSNHLSDLRVLLADQSVLPCLDYSPAEWIRVAAQQSREGEIYRAFKQLIDPLQSEIQSRFPKVMRRVGGYALDAFSNGEIWNFTQLMAGSEGTLGITTEATLKLVEIPQASVLCLAHFTDRWAAIDAVAEMVALKPSAVELIDAHIIEMGRKALPESAGIINGNPNALLMIGFEGDDASLLLEKAKTLQKQLAAVCYHCSIMTQAKEQAFLWEFRKQGLGLIQGMTSARRPQAFIEDAAIPLPYLSNYIRDVVGFCDSMDVDVVLYAHASVGVLHVRPILDLQDSADVERMKAISQHAFKCVMHYRGSWSGEHGDGISRSHYNQEFFGAEIYRAFQQVKTIFDPQHLLNPGVIVQAPAIDAHLRRAVSIDKPLPANAFQYRDIGGLVPLLNLCSGIAACRKTEAPGTMCPSFRVTREEQHSTRGRANALRRLLSESEPMKVVSDPELQTAMSLCLSCKACKSECPSKVDMARLKSELNHWRHQYSGISLTERMIGVSADLAKRAAGIGAPFFNQMLAAKPIRYLLQELVGFDSTIPLPGYARHSLSAWFAGFQQPALKQQVYLFADTYSNYHQPDIGKAAIRLLNALGYRVTLLDIGCCQRPRISQGLLGVASKQGEKMAQRLMQIAGSDVLVLEPSCASSLSDDLPDLLNIATASALTQRNFLSMSEFLLKVHRSGHKIIRFKMVEQAVIHRHCHEKALKPMLDLNPIFESKVEILDNGCCGMAGAFGHRVENRLLAQQLGELAFSEVSASTVIADGFSCRQQLKHFGFPVQHSAEWYQSKI